MEFGSPEGAAAALASLRSNPPRMAGEQAEVKAMSKEEWLQSKREYRQTQQQQRQQQQQVLAHPRDACT